MFPTRASQRFLHEEHGMSGAEKALIIAFGLGITLLVGAMIQGGSDRAAGDARTTLSSAMSGKSSLGQVMQPGKFARASDVQQKTGAVAKSSAVAKSGDMPAPRPAPAPAPAQARPRPYTGAAPPSSVGNFRELAAFVFQRYETGHPIGIIQVQGMNRPTYLIVLSGTERRPGQATWIPEDIFSAFNSSDRFRTNILRAMQDYGIPRGADIIVAGHSLGGMEAQNLITDRRFRDRYNANSVVTFGAPITANNRPGVQYARFAAWGDPVPRASPQGVAWGLGRTAAWGGHYILRGVTLGRVDRRPRYEQEMIGPVRNTPSIAAHSIYETSRDMERFPLNGPDGRPLRLAPGTFRTFASPSR